MIDAAQFMMAQPRTIKVGRTIRRIPDNMPVNWPSILYRDIRGRFQLFQHMDDGSWTCFRLSEYEFVEEAVDFSLQARRRLLSWLSSKMEFEHPNRPGPTAHKDLVTLLEGA